MKKYVLLFLLFSIINIANAQTITSISPNNGSAGNLISAVITGQSTFFQSGSPQGVRSIKLKNNNCQTVTGTNIIAIDNTHLSVDFNIPASQANGLYNLEIANWIGSAYYLNNSFIISGGTTVLVNSISPNSVNENQIVNLTINGQSLDLIYNAGVGINIRKGTKYIHVTNISLVNSNTLLATFYLPAYVDSGNYDVEINGYTGGCYTLLGALHVQTSTPKQLLSISPPQTTAGVTLSAVITSQNTFFMSGSPQGIRKIQLKDQHCNVIDGTTISVLTDTTVSVDFPILTSDRNGFYDIYLETNLYSSYLLPASLEVIGGIDKDLFSFSPSNSIANTTITAIISGNNTDAIFNAVPMNAELKSNSGFRISGTNLLAGSASSTLDFQIPFYADNGNYTLNVTSAAGCYSIPSALQITGGQPRQLVSITPSIGYRGQTLSAVITGSNTFFMSGTQPNGIKKVSFQGTMPGNNHFEILHPLIAVQDSDHISFNFTIGLNMHPGFYNVTVENYAGDQWSLSPGFEIKGAILSGTVRYDADSSGTNSPGDFALPDKHVMLLPDSTISITDINGNFLFIVDTGQYTVQMYNDTNWFVNTTPQQYLINADTSDISLLDFGLRSYTDQYYVYITLASGFPRCNTTVAYNLSYKNFSTTSVSGQVYFIPDSAISFISSTPAFDYISNDTIFWNYNNLPINSTSYITVLVNIPPTPGDTILSFAGVNAIVSGNESANYLNTYTQIIRCSFDPNDKSVEPLGIGNANYVLFNNFLEYLIRFQNTGNDTAYNVMVLDTISDAMDMNTFSIVSKSHPVETHLIDNVAEFRFNNIMLPDSTTNEIESHGYIKYRVKAKATTPAGTSVENHASIYFDLNHPVITNSTINTLTDHLPTGIPNLSLGKENLIIYPNPASQSFNLLLPENFGKTTLIRIVNSQGKIVKSQSISSQLININTENFTEGLYFIFTETGNEKTRMSAKLILLH